MYHFVLDCRKDILVVWDHSDIVARENASMKEFLKKFIKSEKLRVEEKGSHIGFITSFNDNRTTTFLKVGEFKNKAKLIQWLDSFKYDNSLSGSANFLKEAFENVNNVSQSFR